MNAIQKEILNYQINVQLTNPAHGFWDGGAKSYFEFTPNIERTPGKPAIRWGSYSANLWFVIECNQKTVKQHLASVKRKLQGQLARTIIIKKLA